MNYILVLGGLVGLFLGGEFLVRGAVGIARRLAIPPLLIGLTVVGFGTSTPELLVSVDAALRGVPGIAIGNVVGSNIANILLIVGVSSLVWPIRVLAGSMTRDVAVMILAPLLLVPMFATGMVGRPAGLLLVAALAGYLTWAYLHPGPDPEETGAPVLPVWKSLIWVAVGLAALMAGARFLVDGAVAIAREFGASEAFIGLTIVAVGTSLPELATSLIAALRRHSEIAIGNVVGSNVFNILGILGLTAVVAPVPVEARFLSFDLPFMIGVSILLGVLLLWRGGVGRIAGAAMLAGYAAYVWAAQG